MQNPQFTGRLKSLYPGFLVLALSYLPGVFLTSAWSDEYPAMQDPDGLSRELMKAIRPIWALLELITFSLLSTPSLLWIGRLLGFLGVLLLYLTLVEFSPKITIRSSTKIFIAFALCLPSFQNWSHWANAWPQSWAALVSVWSFYLFKKQRISRKILGIVLLAIAFTTYPPSSLFFFGTLPISCWENRASNKAFLSEIIKAVKLLAGAALLSVIISTVLLKILELQKAPRVSLVNLSDLDEKILWFISRPIVVGLRFFDISSPSPLMALLSILPVIIIILGAFVTECSLIKANKIKRATLFSICLGMTLSHLLVIQDNQIEHRYLPGFAFSIFCLFCLSMRKLIKRFLHQIIGKNLAPRIVSFVLVFVAVLIIANTNWRYYVSIYQPYQIKNTFLLNALGECNITSTHQFIEILQPKVSFPVLNRLGTYSQSTDMASDWVPAPNVWLLLSKTNRERLTIHFPGNSQVANACFIDLEVLRYQLIKD